MNINEIAASVTRSTGAKPQYVLDVVELGAEFVRPGRDPVAYFENVIRLALARKVKFPAMAVHFFCVGAPYKP